MLDRLDAADPVRYVAKASTAEREAGLDGWERTTVDDGRQTPIDNPYLRGETQRRNTHPTIKPIDLCRYLATLLLPPAAYGPRRLLVPFSGSGSEMIGAGLAGWEFVQGIELEAEHVAIARARLAWWIDVFAEERAA
jgi:DNA modification methylase